MSGLKIKNVVSKVIVKSKDELLEINYVTT